MKISIALDSLVLQNGNLFPIPEIEYLKIMGLKPLRFKTAHAWGDIAQTDSGGQYHAKIISQNQFEKFLIGLNVEVFPLTENFVIPNDFQDTFSLIYALSTLENNNWVSAVQGYEFANIFPEGTSSNSLANSNLPSNRMRFNINYKALTLTAREFTGVGASSFTRMVGNNTYKDMICRHLDKAKECWFLYAPVLTGVDRVMQLKVDLFYLECEKIG
jgi:hypothetical protein